ncbi:hypothetical protein DFH09DRAFT_1314189 [Mycena vulgaris]|nr:hypothetical protein DFH09DRAFT_1314189 [Mycena vulgaris]
MPPLTPRIPWLPNIKLFDAEAVEKQRHATEIVVFCPALRMPVRLPWPTISGVPIPADLILAFLQKHNLHWPCFCTLLCRVTLPPSTVSCLILNTSKQGVFAVCGRVPAQCSFYMDLSAIHDSTTSVAEYTPLCAELEIDTNASLILRKYLLDAPVELDPFSNAPLLAGYWGEDAKQRGKLLIADPPALHPSGRLPVVFVPPPLPAPHYASASVQVESPFISLPPQALNVLDLPEAILFTTLGRGGGITKEALDVLFTDCPVCKKMFVTGIFPAHHQLCGKPGPVLRLDQPTRHRRKLPKHSH